MAGKPDIFPQQQSQINQGKQFVMSLLQKLPYVQDAISVDDLNTKYDLFKAVSARQEQRVLKNSIVTGPVYQQNQRFYGSGGFGGDAFYHQHIYAQIDADKIRRLSEYRRMAAYAEVGDCLDEICDECIVPDENGDVIKLFLRNTDLSNDQKGQLVKEFKKFVHIYDLPKKGWSYFRQFLTEGEIFFENITSNNKPELGIIGALMLPGELINPIYDNVQNNVIENFILQKPVTLQEPYTPNQLTPSNNVDTLQYQLIPMQGAQITYIQSGIWNEDMTIRIPFIENARRSYKQLSLIEDSIVIYRLVRAPERLKFKIDTGNMPPAEAEAYLRQLMQSYWNKKSYDSQRNNGATNVYDPQSMLDSFWFTKGRDGAGSDVELMQGGQNLGQLEDLMYFVSKLYRSLKVPTTRLNPNEQFKDGSEILREELRFAKFIVRLQQQFSTGIRDAWITHLRLKGIWQEMKLKEPDLLLEFNVPSNFLAIRQQQLFELKQKNFADLSNSEGISKTFAMRHYLDYTNDEISENMEFLRKDAALMWEISQIQTMGPNWRENAQQIADAAGNMQGGPEGMGGGAPSGGGSAVGADTIPDFGSPNGPVPNAAGGVPPGEEQGATPAAETPPA